MSDFNLNIKIEVGETFKKFVDALFQLVRIGDPAEPTAANNECKEYVDERVFETVIVEQTEEQAPPETAGTEQPLTGVELADGIPWDARIHSSSKKKYSKAPFKWHRKKNLDEAVEAEVEAELRALMAIPSSTAATTGTPETTSAAEAFGANSGISEPKTEQAPPPPPPETEAKTDTPEIKTFVQLVQALAANSIDHAVTDPILAKHGVASLPLLGSRPDLIPAVVADVRALGLL